MLIARGNAYLAAGVTLLLIPLALILYSGWRHVDLLKMDVEGMERDIVADGGDWLHRVGLIVLEVHENTSPEELSTLLHPHAWTLQKLGTHDEATYLAARTNQINGFE